MRERVGSRREAGDEGVRVVEWGDDDEGERKARRRDRSRLLVSGGAS